MHETASFVVKPETSPERQAFYDRLDRIDTATPGEEAIHVVLDNLSTHKSPPVQRWLRRHPRVHEPGRS